MGKSNHTIQKKHIIASIVMLLALVWLTVSLPYVNQAQITYEQVLDGAEELDIDNPFANTTEEKSESGANTLSEYLHEIEVIEHHFTSLIKYYKCHPSHLYFAFHPELISPPPEA